MARILLHSGRLSPNEIEFRDHLIALAANNGHTIIEHLTDSFSSAGKPEYQLDSRISHLLGLLENIDYVVTIFSDHNDIVFAFEVDAVATAASSLNINIFVWTPVILTSNAKDLVRNYFYLDGSVISPHNLASQVILRIIENERRKAIVRQKREEAREKLEKNVAKFVEEALVGLELSEKSARRIAYACYIAGYIALIIGIMFAYKGLVDASVIPEGEWIKFSLVGLKSGLIIALAFACSRYTFNLGNSFMNEGLRNANRIHAIRFGKFYLEAFGERADWEQIKEVFQNWNIETTSTFASLDPDKYDPKLVDKVLELAKSALERK